MPGSLPIDTTTTREVPQEESPIPRSAPVQLGMRRVEVVEPEPVEVPPLNQLNAPLVQDQHHDAPQVLPVANPMRAEPHELMTRGELLRQAGNPRNDLKFLGFTLWSKSTAYKQILSTLDQFHAVLSSRTGTPVQKLQRLKALAQSVVDQSTTYLTDTSHTRGAHIRNLQDTANSELRTLAAFEQGPPPIDQWPPDSDLANVMDLVRTGNLPLDQAVEFGRFFSNAEYQALTARGIAPDLLLQLGEAGFDASEIDQMHRAGVDLTGAAALKTRGFSAGFIIEMHQCGLAPDSAEPFLPLQLRPREIQQILNAGGTSQMAKPYRDLGISGSTIADALRHHVSPELAREYEIRGIVINAKTVPGDFNESRQRGNPKAIGSGAFNTVYRVTYELPDGRRVDRVFKEEYLYKPQPMGGDSLFGLGMGGGLGWVSGMTGVSERTPRYGNRNIATSRVAEALGFPVVPHTEFATIRDENGTVRFGIVMDYAPGRTGTQQDTSETVDVTNAPLGRELKRYHEEGIWSDPQVQDAVKRRYNLSSVDLDTSSGRIKVKYQSSNLRDKPGVRHELVKLQLLDAICGQGDRHSSNYMLQYNHNTGEAIVTGIDNDQSFGYKARDPRDLVYGNDEGHYGFRGVQLPPVVDTDMETAILGLTENQLETELRGLMTDREIDSAKERLRVVQQHVRDLRLQGKVIPPTAWGSPQATGFNSNNSYFRRDLR